MVDWSRSRKASAYHLSDFFLKLHTHKFFHPIDLAYLCLQPISNYTVLETMLGLNGEKINCFRHSVDKAGLDFICGF